jgi:uncharacterized membrane protein YphA (DoxX/SURF4 family)
MEMFSTLNFWLWAAQVVLAVMYGVAGVMKTFLPIPDLARMIRWPGDVPAPLVRFIGVVEILGPLGLILPMLTGIAVWLTPLAAIGLTIIQLLAIPFHARRGETKMTLPINLLLLGLSAFVVWGRFPLFGA